jgi:protein-tyrosine phosphatase
MIEKRLLFVCLGNICRSPAAEAVMSGMLKKGGLDRKFSCDSAGITGFHSGSQADERMRKHARKRGYEVTSISRKVRPSTDFDHFDMIIGMDDQNIRDLNTLARSEKDRKLIFRMTDFSANFNYSHIPDPFYGGHAEFELVLDLLEDACGGLINYLEKKEIKGDQKSQ